MWAYQTIDNELGKQAAFNKGVLMLDALRTNKKKISFRPQAHPAVSIVIVSYNAPEMLTLTINSLITTAVCNNSDFEIIIVDNNSDVPTKEFLNLLENVNVVFLPENIGFGKACNLGVSQSRGEYILFLNPDVEILPGGLDALVNVLAADHEVGSVGGRLIWPSGELQEAGAMLLNDEQVTHPYGRGGNPLSPEALFRRNTGYVSGALLLTRRTTFEKLDGFDPYFSPAYFEDTDYCLRNWRNGYKVVYEPDAVAMHFESATAKSRLEVDNLINKHRNFFKERHSKWLFSSTVYRTPLQARDFAKPTLRILIVDDQVPHTDLGAGFPRMNIIIRLMLDLGYFVSVYPLYRCDPDISSRYRDIPREVEILGGINGAYIGDIFKDRGGYYDVLWVSRPHNIKYVLYEMNRIGVKLRNFITGTVVFDCEAIYSLREEVERLVFDQVVTNRDVETAISIEITGYDLADCVVSVSDAETERLLRLGVRNALTLGHSMEINSRAPAFHERSGILFLGSLDNEKAPNADSMRWFLQNIWPLVRNELGDECKINIIGPITDKLRKEFSDHGAIVLGRVPDVSLFIDSARIMVAPTRFAAGLPMKVHESIARGLPAVVTNLLGQQMGWENGTGYLTANWLEPESFLRSILDLYENQDLWDSVIVRGQKAMLKEFEIGAYKHKIKNICETNFYNYV